jgi:photosystem II stability/assembly factor-like uncharacterized protein
LDASDFAIASDGGLVLSVKSDGIYFSNDEGLSWQKNAIGLDHPDSYATSLSSGTNGIVYAIVDDYLYRFEKNSGIWENTGNRFVEESKVIVDKKGSMFILSDSLQVSLFISKDGGYSFDTILNNPKIRDLKAFSINGNDNNYVLVAGNVKSDLYRVSDDGVVVTKIYSASVTNPQMIWDDDGFVFMISSNAEIIRMDSLGKNLSYITWSPYILFRIFKKENGRLLLLTYDGDYESQDQGVNWTKVNSNYYKEGSQDPNYYFDGNTVYLLNTRCISNGLYKTDDEGHNWSEFGNLFSNPFINGLFANSAGNVFSSSFDCYDSRYFYTRDKGLNWKNINIPVSEFGSYSLLSNKRGDLFINSNSKIYKSDDYGRTWYPITIFNNIDLYNLTGDNKNLLFASGGSFMNLGYFSNDGGSNWFIPYFHNQQISSDLQSLYEHPDGTIFSIDDIFYGGLGYSNDRGMNWDTSGIHFDYFYSSCITKSGLIYFCGVKYSPINEKDFGLYVSRDKLGSIDKVFGGLIYDLVSDNDENLYALDSTGGCKKSTDGGKNWINFSGGLPENTYASYITIDNDQYLYIGMENHKIYKTIIPVSHTVATKSNNDIHSVQLIPNPAIDAISLRISVENFSFPMAWNLLDIHGQKLSRGEIDSNKSTINIENLPNGIYFLKFDDPKLPVQKVVVEH